MLVFTKSFGCLFPIQNMGQTHEVMSLLFQHDGVIPVCIVDGTLDQKRGLFRQKLLMLFTGLGKQSFYI